MRPNTTSARVHALMFLELVAQQLAVYVAPLDVLRLISTVGTFKFYEDGAIGACLGRGHLSRPAICRNFYGANLDLAPE